MMRTLVTYVSRTGNTRKVAEAIRQDQGRPRTQGTRQVDSPDGYDLTFVGFPIEHRFSPAEPAATFLSREVGELPLCRTPDDKSRPGRRIRPRGLRGF